MKLIITTLINMLLFFIIAGLFIGIVALAEVKSWYYLFVFIPIIVIIYESEKSSRNKTKRYRKSK